MQGYCTLVITGAPLASRATDLFTALSNDGWRVQVIASMAARQHWQVESSPTPDRRVSPDVVAVAPATFNMINKVAGGIADTTVAGLLCEVLGAGTPMVMVPMAKHALWGHPRFVENLSALTNTGVLLLDPISGTSRPTAIDSGSGDQVAAQFDVSWLVDAVRAVTRARLSPAV